LQIINAGTIHLTRQAEQVLTERFGNPEAGFALEIVQT